MKVFVTGGLGYIGSHACVELLEQGHDVVIADNLANSSAAVLERIHEITGKRPVFYESDVRDIQNIEKVFDDHPIDAVIHFAGLKSVGESIKDPLLYYDVNIISTLSLLKVMRSHNVKRLLFSSSATVYGTPSRLPITESDPVGNGITNAYGRTKYIIEQILADESRADESLEISVLRYFNPIGAHASGLIGESPRSTPNNLLPYITQVAVGKLDKLSIYGGDYDTPDGTGIRDYIHVVDLAQGHIAALNASKKGIDYYNLGTGHGVSVLELVRLFERVSSVNIPYAITKRRPGDVADCYASVEKASRELGWHTKKTTEDGCRDSWNWQSKNPDGYS